MCCMSKFYNTFSECSSGFMDFLHSYCPFLSKPLLNIMPDVLSSMILSSSCITKNIASNCKGRKFDFIHPDSKKKRVRRFFNNKLYDPYLIYDSIIKHVISRFNCKHGDNFVHVVFDHMFLSERFVTFMISLRIGKKSVPLWFRCFPDGHSSNEAFQESLITKGIQYVIDLFADKPNYKLVFLADRWFGSTSLLDFIVKSGHLFVVRAKDNYNVWYHNNKEGHVIKSKIKNLFHYTHKATYYENVLVSDSKFKTNIVFSATKSVSISNKTDSGEVDEPWILFTNCDVRRAIKWYGYRFGAIEFLFKDQKSNGFNLQKTGSRNLQAFTMMYTCVNICILYLTCLATHFTKNKNGLYSHVHIHYFSVSKGKNVRIMSVFQVGLELFKHAYNSEMKIYIPYTFILHDL